MSVKLIFKIIAFVGFINPITTTAQSSWSSWIKYPSNPVYFHNTLGAWNVASDPTVIKDSLNYIMIVSGGGGSYAGSIEGNVLIQATSTDGINWNTLPNGQNGVVVTGYPNDWDESMELPEIIKLSNKYSLFYCGYNPAVRDSSSGLVWGDLGLAESTDGVNYVKIGSPVMTRTPNWYDQDGITDPTIVESNDTLFMIYVGWCTQSCALNSGSPAFYSLKAISIDVGHTWIKQGLLDSTGMIGLQHPDLVYDADGKYSLFFGVDNACSENKIGIFHSVGNLPFGPFLPNSPSPIFCMGTQSFETNGTDGGFPTVINDNGMGRMWYTGVDTTNFHYKIGLIESNLATPVIESDYHENLFVLMPNPAQNKLNIEMSVDLKNTEIKIYNQLGQIEKVILNINNRNISIETFDLSNGLYLIVLQNDNRLANGKFIINK